MPGSVSSSGPSSTASTPYKIPKKLNSQVWPKEVRPSELEDDEIFDELPRYSFKMYILSHYKILCRPVALKAVQKEKESRLLSRKLDMEMNKGKSLEKPDEIIKEVSINAERDNASDMLAQCRFTLRPEVVEPSSFWHRVSTKWPEVHRSIPLQWSGREHMSKTIELMHNLSNVIKVKGN